MSISNPALKKRQKIAATAGPARMKYFEQFGAVVVETVTRDGVVFTAYLPDNSKRLLLGPIPELTAPVDFCMSFGTVNDPLLLLNTDTELAATDDSRAIASTLRFRRANYPTGFEGTVSPELGECNRVSWCPYHQCNLVVQERGGCSNSLNAKVVSVYSDRRAVIGQGTRTVFVETITGGLMRTIPWQSDLIDVSIFRDAVAVLTSKQDGSRVVHVGFHSVALIARSAVKAEPTVKTELDEETKVEQEGFTETLKAVQCQSASARHVVLTSWGVFILSDEGDVQVHMFDELERSAFPAVATAVVLVPPHTRRSRSRGTESGASLCMRIAMEVADVKYLSRTNQWQAVAAAVLPSVTVSVLNMSSVFLAGDVPAADVLIKRWKQASLPSGSDLISEWQASLPSGSDLISEWVKLSSLLEDTEAMSGEVRRARITLEDQFMTVLSDIGTEPKRRCVVKLEPYAVLRAKIGWLANPGGSSSGSRIDAVDVSGWIDCPERAHVQFRNTRSSAFVPVLHAEPVRPFMEITKPGRPGRPEQKEEALPARRLNVFARARGARPVPMVAAASPGSEAVPGVKIKLTAAEWETWTISQITPETETYIVDSIAHAMGFYAPSSTTSVMNPVAKRLPVQANPFRNVPRAIPPAESRPRWPAVAAGFSKSGSAEAGDAVWVLSAIAVGYFLNARCKWDKKTSWTFGKFVRSEQDTGLTVDSDLRPAAKWIPDLIRIVSGKHRAVSDTVLFKMMLNTWCYWEQVFAKESRRVTDAGESKDIEQRATPVSVYADIRPRTLIFLFGQIARHPVAQILHYQRMRSEPGALDYVAGQVFKLAKVYDMDPVPGSMLFLQQTDSNDDFLSYLRQKREPQKEWPSVTVLHYLDPFVADATQWAKKGENAQTLLAMSLFRAAFPRRRLDPVDWMFEHSKRLRKITKVDHGMAWIISVACDLVQPPPEGMIHECICRPAFDQNWEAPGAENVRSCHNSDPTHTDLVEFYKQDTKLSAFLESIDWIIPGLNSIRDKFRLDDLIAAISSVLRAEYVERGKESEKVDSVDALRQKIATDRSALNRWRRRIVPALAPAAAAAAETKIEVSDDDVWVELGYSFKLTYNRDPGFGDAQRQSLLSDPGWSKQKDTYFTAVLEEGYRMTDAVLRQMMEVLEAFDTCFEEEKKVTSIVFEKRRGRAFSGLPFKDPVAITSEMYSKERIRLSNGEYDSHSFRRGVCEPIRFLDVARFRAGTPGVHRSYFAWVERQGTDTSQLKLANKGFTNANVSYPVDGGDVFLASFGNRVSVQELKKTEAGTPGLSFAMLSLSDYAFLAASIERSSAKKERKDKKGKDIPVAWKDEQFRSYLWHVVWRPSSSSIQSTHGVIMDSGDVAARPTANASKESALFVIGQLRDLFQRHRIMTGEFRDSSIYMSLAVPMGLFGGPRCAQQIMDMLEVSEIAEQEVKKHFPHLRFDSRDGFVQLWTESPQGGMPGVKWFITRRAIVIDSIPVHDSDEGAAASRAFKEHVLEIFRVLADLAGRTIISDPSGMLDDPYSKRRV